MPLFKVRKVMIETIPLIILFGMIEFVTGGFLTGLTKEIEMLPGILILVPPLLGMRGNIGSSLGARLTSGLHMGVIRPGKITNDLKKNLYSSLLMSLIMSTILAVFAWLVCLVTGGLCISLYAFLLISLISGVTSGAILSFVAVLVSFMSYNRGLDPDDVTTPSIGSIGDIVTVICLFITVKFVLGLGI
jgi:mgtE-like transporter